MTEPTTTADLRDLLAKATPKAWTVREGDPFVVEFSGRMEDVRLAVAAVNALPALLDVVDAARALYEGSDPQHGITCGPDGCRCGANDLDAALGGALRRLDGSAS